MKTTTFATTLSLLATLLLALSLAFACGDDGDGGSPTATTDDSDDLPGYFADLQRIFENADDATNEAEDPLNETSSGAELDVKLSALDTYLGEIDTIFDEAIGLLHDLEVPTAAAEHHQDFIDGVRESITASDTLRSDLTNITTDEQLDDRLATFDSGIDAAVDKADAACLALQEIADTEEITIDLACED